MLNWIYSISVIDDVALYILVRYMKNLKNQLGINHNNVLYNHSVTAIIL